MICIYSAWFSVELATWKTTLSLHTPFFWPFLGILDLFWGLILPKPGRGLIPESRRWTWTRRVPCLVHFFFPARPLTLNGLDSHRPANDSKTQGFPTSPKLTHISSIIISIFFYCSTKVRSCPMTFRENQGQSHTESGRRKLRPASTSLQQMLWVISKSQEKHRR